MIFWNTVILMEQRGLNKKVVRPPQRREMAAWVAHNKMTSVRVAWDAFGVRQPVIATGQRCLQKMRRLLTGWNDLPRTSGIGDSV